VCKRDSNVSRFPANAIARYVKDCSPCKTWPSETAISVSQAKGSGTALSREKENVGGTGSDRDPADCAAVSSVYTGFASATPWRRKAACLLDLYRVRRQSPADMTPVDHNPNPRAMISFMISFVPA
jgi:hypothetical protein